MLFSKIFGVDKFSHKSKSKNLCYYVGRGRSFNRKLYMARHTIRKFARFGMLPGFIKERC
jgi:ribosomal protein S14